MPAMQQWLGIVFILILVFLVISPNMKADTIIKELGSFQIGAIKALQGRE